MIEFNLITTFLVILAVVLVGKWFQATRSLPPGPWGLPVIGALWVMASGTPTSVFRRLRKVYGDVFSIRVGSDLLVVLNGYDTVKEALVKRADDFSDRPNTFGNKHIVKGRGIIASSGQHWKQTRTFSLGALREFGFGKKSLEARVKEEVDVFVDVIAKQKGKAFDICDIIHVSVSNIICSIVFGNRFDHGDEEFKWLLNLIDLQSASSTNIATSIPLLRLLPGDRFKIKAFKNNMFKLVKYFENCVTNHKSSFEENDIRDFIDLFLKEQLVHEEGNPVYRDDNMAFTILHLFLAGTETTVTSIRWTIIYLLHNPEVQNRMFEEIKTTIGLSRAPTVADKENMPYCTAVMTEVFRMSNVVPLSLPHSTKTDVSFRGYRIPRGAFILPNLDSILKDPNLFPNPDKFDPGRFLDSNGHFKGDEKVVAFSMGRRVCLGESLARTELFLFLISFLQRFEAQPSETLPSLEGIFGITYGPKPYEFRAVERK